MSRAGTDQDHDSEPVYGSRRIPIATPSSHDHGHLDGSPTAADSETGGRQRYVISVVEKARPLGSLLCAGRRPTQFESAKRGVPTV